MSIVDALRRASEALREHADDLQALSDEVHIAGGEMSDEQVERITKHCIGICDASRLGDALDTWWQARRDKARGDKKG